MLLQVKSSTSLSRLFFTCVINRKNRAVETCRTSVGVVFYHVLFFIIFCVLFVLCFVFCFDFFCVFFFLLYCFFGCVVTYLFWLIFF